MSALPTRLNLITEPFFSLLSQPPMFCMGGLFISAEFFKFAFYGTAVVRKLCIGQNGTAGVSGADPALGVIRYGRSGSWFG